MKKLTGVLVLSSSLLLISGCRSAGETRHAEDASTPSSAPSSTVTQGLAGEQAPGGNKAATELPPAVRQAQESCLDQWLQAQKMDPYGHPEGTMYAGGTPLFNEATGESRDRLEYVYERLPAAKAACINAGQAPK